MKSNEEILRTFYQVEPRHAARLRVALESFRRPDRPAKLSHEIKNPKTDDVLVGAHKRVTEACTRTGQGQGARRSRFGCGPGRRVHRRRFSESPNRRSPARGQQTPDAEIWSALGEAEITSVDVSFRTADDVGMVLSRTLDKDAIKSPREALIEIYRKLRPGDPPNARNRHSLFNGHVFRPRKYDFSRVGRLKFNIKFGLETSLNTRTARRRGFRRPRFAYLLKLRKNIGTVDDIDHLGNRPRARGWASSSRTSSASAWSAWSAPSRKRCRCIRKCPPPCRTIWSTPRPVMAAIREFFGSSQLSQFMDQTNPLSEINPDKRRRSPLSGRGGLIAPSAPIRSATFPSDHTMAASVRLRRRKSEHG